MADESDQEVIFELERVQELLEQSLPELDSMRATCQVEVDDELSATQMLQELRTVRAILYVRLEQRARHVNPRDPATMEVPLFTPAQSEAANAVLRHAQRATERAWSDRLAVLASVTEPCEYERLRFVDELRERARVSPRLAPPLQNLAHAVEWAAAEVEEASANVDEPTAQRAVTLAQRCPEPISTHLLVE